MTTEQTEKLERRLEHEARKAISKETASVLHPSELANKIAQELFYYEPEEEGVAAQCLRRCLERAIHRVLAGEDPYDAQFRNDFEENVAPKQLEELEREIQRRQGSNT